MEDRKIGLLSPLVCEPRCVDTCPHSRADYVVLDDPVSPRTSSSVRCKLSSKRLSPRHTWKLPFVNGADADDLVDFSLTADTPLIGFAAVVAMTFFNVSGGPWGSEDIFSASNPMTGTVAILLFTIFFCVPQIFLTSELSCALPSNGGYSIWIREAFGDFWAFQLTYWQWVSGVADAAVYPVVICDSLLLVTGYKVSGPFEAWSLRVLTTSLLSLPTFVSIKSVPSMLIGMAIATGVPVLAFIVKGGTQLQTSSWFTPRESPDFGKMINVLYWNLEGWDCISTVSAFVKEPREKNIPRGLFVGLFITSTQYILVLLVAAGINQDRFPWQDWNDGTIPSIGCSMGTVMCGLLMSSSLIGNAGQYLSEFLEDSYLLQGASQIGIVPRVLSYTSANGAPLVANAVQLIIILAMLTFDFSEIIIFDNFFGSLAIMAEFFAFFELRRNRPEMDRPFRTPTWALVLFPFSLVIDAVVIFHCLTKSPKVTAISCLAFLSGVPYGLWVARRSQKEHARGERSALDHFLEDS